MLDWCLDRPRGARFRLVLRQVRRELVKLPDFAVSSPTQIAATRTPQVKHGKPVKTARLVEGGSALICNRFVVDEGVGLCGLDGLLVEMFGINHAILQARNFGADQRRAARKVLRGMVSPFLETAVMTDQALTVMGPVVGRCAVAERCQCQR